MASGRDFVLHGYCVRLGNRENEATMSDTILFAVRGRWKHLPSIVDLIDASGDCWEWTGTITSLGYGRLEHNDRRWLAHRLVWTLLVGMIEPNRTLDHLCQNRRCVNPDHLEPVTQGVNARRALHRSVCKKGHILSIKKNRYQYATGSVVCRPCDLERQAKNREQRRVDYVR